MSSTEYTTERCDCGSTGIIHVKGVRTCVTCGETRKPQAPIALPCNNCGAISTKSFCCGQCAIAWGEQREQAEARIRSLGVQS